MKTAKINLVTLNLKEGKLLTEFQINGREPEIVASQGIASQLEGNLKNLDFIINYAKEQGYDNIEIHAVIPTQKQVIEGVEMPTFQEQTADYVSGKYKANSTTSKDLLKTIDKFKKDSKEGDITFVVDLQKEKGMEILNAMKEIKSKSLTEYNTRFHLSTEFDRKKEVKTTAFQNSYIPSKPKEETEKTDFDLVMRLQKREQARQEKWKNVPFALEIYNDKEEKQPIIMEGASELGSLETAIYLADWWEQVEKKNVQRVGELKKHAKVHNLSDKVSSLSEDDFLYFVKECKKKHNIVEDIFDVESEIMLNKTIDIQGLTSEENLQLLHKMKTEGKEIIYELSGDTEQFRIKIISDNSLNLDFSDKVYSVDELLQLQREKNIISLQSKTETLGNISEKPVQKEQPKEQSQQNGFGGFGNRFVKKAQQIKQQVTAPAPVKQLQPNEPDFENSNKKGGFRMNFAVALKNENTNNIKSNIKSEELKSDNGKEPETEEIDHFAYKGYDANSEDNSVQLTLY